MRILIAALMALLMASGAVLLMPPAYAATPAVSPAASISGTWQGILGTGAQSLRLVFHIRKDKRGELQGTMYSIDRGPNPIPVTAVSQTDSTVKLAIAALGGSYEGSLSRDGASIDGTWQQAGGVPLMLRRTSKRNAWPLDSSPHSVRFVTVDHDVKLEVLDWGGDGRPLVLLSGLGDDAHVYDAFAPKLTGSYHVVGITRRGFGASSAPAAGYSADRLGDDVLEALESLHIVRPVLVGHDIAGEELSSIGVRHPDKVGGLIYLDAGYAYAFYNEERGDLTVDGDVLQRELEALRNGDTSVAQQLQTADLPRLAHDLEYAQESWSTAAPPAPGPPPPPAVQAVRAGMQRYRAFSGVPVLAIYADPHDGLESDPATENQAADLEQALPAAHVLRLAHANHYVFRSSEADVLFEIEAFIAGLPAQSAEN